MAPQKSPAFQFYPKDFASGTATMSLQEVGAYIRLLCYAWDAGSVPNDADERARILGCAKAQERELWKKVSKKFVLQDDVFVNERMEDERRKQSEYRRRQSDKGKASAATRRQSDINHGSTTVASRLQPEGNSANCSLQSSSSVQEQKPQQRGPSRGSGLIPSPAYIAHRSQFCAFVGSRLEVPNALHAELRDGHGLNAEDELQAWYAELNETAEVQGWRVPRDNGIFKWLKDHYAAKFPPTPVAGAKSIDEQLDEWARS